jgi:hypothetical protein
MDQRDAAEQDGIGIHAVLEAEIEDRKSGQGGDHYAQHGRMVEGGGLTNPCGNQRKCGAL